jgi:hypothetical protein
VRKTDGMAAGAATGKQGNQQRAHGQGMLHGMSPNIV